MSPKHIIIYSHGWGVKKDDRGLFTDLEVAMPELEHVLFDYNQVDEEKKEIKVATIKEQVAQLRKVVKETRDQFPDAIVDIVAHSQGCVVAAEAVSNDIRKTILLAPPPDLEIGSRIEKYGKKPGAVINLEGFSYIPGRDGYTKVVPSAYWKGIEGLDPIGAYKMLGHTTKVVFVAATQDEIVGQLPEAMHEEMRVIRLRADHNFTGEARPELIKWVRQELIGLEDYIAKTIQAYDDVATYEASTKEMIPVIDLGELCERMVPGARILDAGCAYGRDTVYLASKGFEVWGVDLSPSLIARAQELAPDINFQVKDIRNTGFEENFFDGIWSNATLLHLNDEDMLAALKELHRVLKPGGTLVLSLKKGEGTQEFVESFSSNSMRFFNFKTHESFLQLLEQSGLEEVKWYYFNERERYGEEKRDLEWLCSISKKPQS